MRKLTILILALTLLSCSKDDDNKSGLVTIEYVIENGVSEGQVTVNVKGEKKTESAATGPSFTLNREVSPEEWYYLSYVTKTPVPQNFKMYVKINGRIDETITTSSANWGYTYTITR